MTTDPTRTALLATIVAHPDEDMPRLEFADYLDEQEPLRVVCPRCKGECRRRTTSLKWSGDEKGQACHLCTGTGTVTDDTARKWAEFIRVQYELGRLLDGWKPETWDCLDMYLDPQDREDQEWKHKVWAKREREFELLRTLEPVLRRGAKCERCDGDGKHRHTTVLGSGKVILSPTSQPCRDCCDVGWLGSLNEPATFDSNPRHWLVPITRWRCGFPDAVSCTLGWFTKNGPKLVVEHPITSVILTDNDMPGVGTK